MIDVLVIEPGSWKARRESIEPNLDTFQRLVGGNIEALFVNNEVNAYIDEEGKYSGAERNEAGTRFMEPALFTGDFIAGPLVLTGQPDEEGDDTGVPESVLPLLKQAGITIGAGPAVEVTVPDVIESHLTGRDKRTLKFRLATSIENVWLEVSTHHVRERKVFSSMAVGVRTFPGEQGPFRSSLYSLMDNVSLGRVPVARYSEKALREAHDQAVTTVRTALLVDPDAFTGVLLKTPQRDS